MLFWGQVEWFGAVVLVIGDAAIALCRLLQWLAYEPWDVAFDEYDVFFLFFYLPFSPEWISRLLLCVGPFYFFRVVRPMKQRYLSVSWPRGLYID